MLQLAFEIVALVAVSAILGAIVGYFLRKARSVGNARMRAIIAAAKAQPPKNGV